MGFDEVDLLDEQKNGDGDLGGHGSHFGEFAADVGEASC
jgi:hypothetical protein